MPWMGMVRWVGRLARTLAAVLAVGSLLPNCSSETKYVPEDADSDGSQGGASSSGSPGATSDGGNVDPLGEGGEGASTAIQTTGSAGGNDSSGSDAGGSGGSSAAGSGGSGGSGGGDAVANEPECTDPSDCDDDRDCTTDLCVNGMCRADDSECECETAEHCNDLDPCTLDVCMGQRCQHPPADGGTCNDGNACTSGDSCVEGVCMGQAVSCDDDEPCTDDSCSPESGCVHENNSDPCDDADACTVDDVCDGGSCIGNTRNCDDGEVCTTDACDPASGCMHTNNSNSCDDDNACTTVDVCVAGSCEGYTPLSCDDDNPCTNDSCSPSSGCVHTNNTASCNDGGVCTSNDACGQGSCGGSTIPNCTISNTEFIDYSGVSRVYPKIQSFTAPAPQISGFDIHLENAVIAGQTFQVRVLSALPNVITRTEIDASDLQAKTLAIAQNATSGAGFVEMTLLGGDLLLETGATYYLYMGPYDDSVFEGSVSTWSRSADNVDNYTGGTAMMTGNYAWSEANWDWTFRMRVD